MGQATSLFQHSLTLYCIIAAWLVIIIIIIIIIADTKACRQQE